MKLALAVSSGRVSGPASIDPAGFARANRPQRQSTMIGGTCPGEKRTRYTDGYLEQWGLISVRMASLI